MDINDLILPGLWFAAVSAAGCIAAVYDKLSAKAGRRRVRESTLLILAFLGAALPMYAVMRLIRHKTRHKRFMIGLPLIGILHLALIACLAYLIL